MMLMLMLQKRQLRACWEDWGARLCRACTVARLLWQCAPAEGRQMAHGSRQLHSWKVLQRTSDQRLAAQKQGPRKASDEQRLSIQLAKFRLG